MPDATYLADAALRAFQRRQKLQELDLEGSYDRTDYQEAIRRLQQQRAPALQSTREGANRQGLFYSGQLGKQLGEVETQFARQEGDQTRDHDRRQAGRDAARRAIEAGAPLEEAAGLAAAADRQIQRDTDTADQNALVDNPAPAASPAARPAPRPAVRPRMPARPAVRPRPPNQQSGRGRIRPVRR